VGTEEFWIPAAIAALGTGVQQYGASQANGEAQKVEAQGLAQQQALRQQAAGNVNKTVQQVQQSNPAALQRQSTTDFVNNLRANASATNSGAPAVPGASSRYGAANATGANTVDNFGNTLASDLGGMDAAVKQRQQEGSALQTLGTNNGLLGEQSAADAFITQLRAAQAATPNPWYKIGGGALQAGAMGLGMSGILAPGAAAPGTAAAVGNGGMGFGTGTAGSLGAYTPAFDTGYGASGIAAGNNAWLNNLFNAKGP
jgi:hypothetical protein